MYIILRMMISINLTQKSIYVITQIDWSNKRAVFLSSLIMAKSILVGICLIPLIEFQILNRLANQSNKGWNC